MEEITDIHIKQKILVESLRCFAKICEDNKITFWLSNGSLLGAIKYNGFIPWDDDIDVMMNRDDYEKFIRINNYNNEKYSIISTYSNERWKYPFAKFSDLSTYVEEDSFDLGVNYGLSIDVFPIDNWKGDKKKAIYQAKYCKFICRCLYTSTSTRFITRKKGIKKFILFILYVFCKMLGSAFFYKLIMNEIKKGKDQTSIYVGSVSWAPYGGKEVLNKDWVSSFVKCVFEGDEYNAPIGYNNYLNQLYGDYSRELPESNQVSNHSMKVWKRN